MNRLKELRKEKGLTQQGLADEIGTTKLTVSNWENEKHVIKSDKAQQLADYFGVSVGYLLGYEENITDQLARELFSYLTVEEKEIFISDPYEQQRLLSIAFERMENVNELAKSQIELEISAFNTDFLDFLKYHDLYLSDAEINKVINIMYSYSNANNLYLSSLLRDKNIEELRRQKTKDFSELFKYSSLWRNNYEGIEKVTSTKREQDTP